MKRSAQRLMVATVVGTLTLVSAAIGQTMHAASPPEAQPTGHPMMNPDPAQGSGMMDKHGPMMQMHAAQASNLGLTMPGQDAFGAIQEIVLKLEADPKTDWSKVDLEALRQHLIDMDEVTLRAVADSRQIDGGLSITVTGSGRTLSAIHHMIAAHAREINGLYGWNARSESLADGERLIVTASDPRQVERIRGLGFIGLMVSGIHHQPHHLAIAKGQMVH
ncbi:MAG: hypothetical protein E6H66_03365 [Betaproteobacteria bacterium]|nr:MAG: hypothetical protein E6H66_03365 [Betaproteobacteria bacterium]